MEKITFNIFDCNKIKVAPSLYCCTERMEVSISAHMFEVKNLIYKLLQKLDIIQKEELYVNLKYC